MPSNPTTTTERITSSVLAPKAMSSTPGTPQIRTSARPPRSRGRIEFAGMWVRRLAAVVAFDLFIEPQCPHCGHFVAEYGDAIAKYLASGRISVTIRPLTFLDNGSDDYSARATNAIFLVAADDASSPALVWGFIQGLYAKLMSTGSVADDDGIAQVANDVGVSADTVNRIAAAESEVDGNDVSDGNLSIM